MNKTIFSLSVLAVFSFVFCSCKSRKDIKLNHPITISVSIVPQKYIIDRLTDSSIEVNVMVPPGTSPEMYEPSPVQMKNVANSAIYFALGPLEFESTILPRIKELNPNIKFVDLSKGINLLEGHKHREIMGEEEHHTNYDPHIWTSTIEFSQMASKTCKELCILYPDKEKTFLKNLDKLNADVIGLDSLIKSVIKTSTTKDFLIYHPALSYFARDYGLNQIAIEEDGKNPSAQTLTKLIKLAKSQGLNTIFIQAQFDSHNAEILAWELGGNVVKIDPLGYDWLKNMYDLTNKLAVALKSGKAAQNNE
ncbi:MAG: zinc ABC transporter substrate-binding protein [Bacteroidales bacterium]|nr:zinc ABC transporter substrate-binding protein [Bacteroidales bacterium]